MKQGYYFKISKVKGNTYLQIWKDGEFVLSCGSAKKLHEKLVLLANMEKLNVDKTNNETNIDFMPMRYDD